MSPAARKHRRLLFGLMLVRGIDVTERHVDAICDRMAELWEQMSQEERDAEKAWQASLSARTCQYSEQLLDE
jgi:hypothetical protein